MATVVHRELQATGARFWLPLTAIGALIAAGFAAFVHMETQGHVVTGMDNQIVWGLPHVFAVFLIVAASGALNVASVASVFGRAAYKPLAPLSALVAIALLAGGLAILAADLGRADRLVVAMTHFNFKSIFALNMFLYSGFFAIVAVYLWFMMERRMNEFTGAAGLAAFLWRIVLTTGTGSIFGFLVAREAYDSALLGPTFVVYSLAYGTAAFLVVLELACRWDARAIDPELVGRLGRLLAVLVAAALYMTAVFHLTKLYTARSREVEAFLLVDGGVYPLLFWLGQVVAGGALPLALLYSPAGRTRGGVLAASVAVVLGGLAQMYVTILGAQAWPQPIFPGWQESSSFFDGEVHPYAPSGWELLLGLGGVALAAALTAAGLKALPFLPDEPCTASSSPQPTSPPARPR